MLTAQRGLAGPWSTKVSAPEAAVGSVVHFTFHSDFNPDMKIEELQANKHLGVAMRRRPRQLDRQHVQVRLL